MSVRLLSVACIVSASLLAAPAKAGEATDAAVGAITNADTVEAAAAAYRQAMPAERGSLRVHEAYLHKMIALGNLRRAHEPARFLVFMDDSNAPAWAVVAWYETRGGDFREGLQAVVRAVDLSPNQTGILELAGQLVAWFDTAPSESPLRSAEGVLLAKHRPVLMQKGPFAREYESVKAARLAARAKAGAAGQVRPALPAADGLAGAASGGRPALGFQDRPGAADRGASGPLATSGVLRFDPAHYLSDVLADAAADRNGKARPAAPGQAASGLPGRSAR